jgi:hypothetical protein
MAKKQSLPINKTFAISQEMDERIEVYRRSQKRLPNESEALRRLIDAGLSMAEATYSADRSAATPAAAKG